MDKCTQCAELSLNASTGKYDGEVDLDYSCNACSHSVHEDEVVIITKAEYQRILLTNNHSR